MRSYPSSLTAGSLIGPLSHPLARHLFLLALQYKLLLSKWHLTNWTNIKLRYREGWKVQSIYLKSCGCFIILLFYTMHFLLDFLVLLKEEQT